MELKDLVEGEVYYVEYWKDKWCIIKASNNEFQNSAGYYYKNKNYNYLKTNMWSCKSNIRIATHKEKVHLNACIKANKYVECPTIKENVLNSLEIW